MTNKEKKEISTILNGKMNTKSIIKKMCGDFLFGGLYRDVWVLKSNPNYVVKMERDFSTLKFANATEWANWQINIEYDKLNKWLAPCILISNNSQFLIQKRLTHGKRKDYPKYIPKLFTDLKLQNFGWIGSDFVCCDYSFFIQCDPEKMKYAKWWNAKIK